MLPVAGRDFAGITQRDNELDNQQTDYRRNVNIVTGANGVANYNFRLHRIVPSNKRSNFASGASTPPQNNSKGMPTIGKTI